jgi:hypothetical protein
MVLVADVCLARSPVLLDIALGHGSAALVPLVVLSWALQRGVAVLPRSSSDAHIRANARLLGGSGGRDEELGVFLTREELSRIDDLDGQVDSHRECKSWAAEGECAANPGYMLTSCRAACGSGSAGPLGCTGQPAADDASGDGLDEL